MVRQWILAGEPVRAVLIARRTGAFSGAIVRLEKSHPDLAQTLRREWAERLAEAGDYAGAVEALWPLEALRPAALPWIDQAISLGGPAAGRMLARKIGLLPHFFPAVRRPLDWPKRRSSWWRSGSGCRAIRLRTSGSR
jgi:hypothetical protein